LARHGYITTDWSHPFADPDAAARQPSPAPNGGGLDVTLSGPQQRILNSLATWKQIGEAPPSNAQVAWLAGNSPSSSSYANPRSALKTAILIEYPSPDHVAITDVGEAQSSPIDLQSSLLDFVVANLRGPERRIPRGNRRTLPERRSQRDRGK